MWYCENIQLCKYNYENITAAYTRNQKYSDVTNTKMNNNPISKII